MALTAAEQYLLELINRARLDPAAEAKRLSINLNDSLAPGSIDASSKQVLAPNALLETAAIAHSQWMLAADVFSHTGANGSTPAGRAKAAGYNWNLVGENIAMQGSSGKLDAGKAIAAEHDGLMRSAGHRLNLMNEGFREVGIAQELGVFTQAGQNYNASMVAEVFGRSANTVFVTGVAYNDKNKDGFYSIGEAQAGVTLSVAGQSTKTQTAGGYALGVVASDVAHISGTVGKLSFTADLFHVTDNVKLDVVNGNTLYSSASISLGTGINSVRLLGIDNLQATGNASANTITGGNGNNLLQGLAGNDKIYGGAGADRLLGGDGNDSLSGDAGRDWLDGGAGKDLLTGGLDADVFVFTKGSSADIVADFKLSQGDSLQLDDALWNNRDLSAAQVVAQYAHVVKGAVLFDFGGGQSLKLTGVTSLSGLADHIDFI